MALAVAAVAVAWAVLTYKAQGVALGWYILPLRGDRAKDIFLTQQSTVIMFGEKDRLVP